MRDIGGPNGRIAVVFVEWSGPFSQKIVVDWMLISDDKTAHLLMALYVAGATGGGISFGILLRRPSRG
jgi:hypothetical protein